jgi:hypothetical protein
MRVFRLRIRVYDRCHLMVIGSLMAATAPLNGLNQLDASVSMTAAFLGCPYLIDAPKRSA